MITVAQNHGWLVRRPFRGLTGNLRESTERDYLTKDEIRQMLDLKFRRKSMEFGAVTCMYSAALPARPFTEYEEP